MRRLGLNQSGYRGETIDIDRVLAEACEQAAQQRWECCRMPLANGQGLWVFDRAIATPLRRVYLSTGIHGDEPAGPLAVAQLLRESVWPDGTAVSICPCLNPTGFPLNCRESASGHDLNRDYRHLETPEIRGHVAWLERQPAFDLTICVHEDWESPGFYLYELNPDRLPSLAEKVIEAVGRVCPVDLSSVIEGRPAQGGIIRPSLDPGTRPQWPEAFYLLQNKTRLSYTLEAPSDFPMATRVNALVAAMRVLLAG